MITNLSTIKRTIVLFPKTCYTEESSVRHARRGYLKALEYLRTSGDSSKWLLDQKVNRLN